MIRFVVLVLLASSCGSIVYINEVTRTATMSFEAARREEADKYSPYYWTRAQQYLMKARERAAHADFQGANRFGRLAAAAAELAQQEAIVAKNSPATVAPAKATP